MMATHTHSPALPLPLFPNDSKSGTDWLAATLCVCVVLFLLSLSPLSPLSPLSLFRYECAPMSFLAEQAGGKGSTGKGRVLDIVPEQVHQRCPLFIGSTKEVEIIENFLK